MKPEALRGLKDPELMLNAVETLSETEKKYARKMPVPPNMRINEDPHSYRCGIIHSESVQQMMLEEVQKVKSFISVKQVACKVTMSLKELEEL